MRFSYMAWFAGMIILLSAPQQASAQNGWPEVFDPLRLLTLNLEMDAGDWNTIQHDDSFSIQVPAFFWADAEEPLLVTVRRKSSDALNNGGGFRKVSLKIDVNALVNGQKWHDLTKLSLENGDDQDVVTEGFAWQLHRMASGPQGYGYAAGMVSWVRLNINDTYTGVYVNAEQRNKQFLRNRELYTPGETWLYKVGDINGLELKVGDGESPTVAVLCYSPFRRQNRDCPTPGNEALAAELPQLIVMRGMMSLAAVNAFTGNPDAMLSHAKNFYFADFLSGRKRMYFPWDLDSVLGGNAGRGIYNPRSAYSEILLNVPEFRELFSRTLNDLLCGPLSGAQLVGFLNALEPVLTDALAADPNNQIGSDIAGHFDSLRNWIVNRIADLELEIENFETCGGQCEPCDMNCDGDINAFDIEPFLDLLFGGGTPCAPCTGDVNGDGNVDAFDIEPFLNCLFP